MVQLLNALGVPRGPKARAGGDDEGGGGGTPLRKGSREKIFEFNMSVEAILMHFETIHACKIRLIVQAFHVAVFKCFSNSHH